MVLAAVDQAYRGPVVSPSAPNAETVSRFLAWWFTGCTRGFVEIAWKDAETGKLRNARHFQLGDPAISAFVAEVNAVPGQDCYFTASTVTLDALQRAKDLHFAESPGIWVDLDEPGVAENSDHIETPIRPHAKVITGRIPHLRQQMFIRASEPIADPALLRQLNKRLCALYSGDAAVCNPVRLMRLPGTISWPWKPGRTAPELTEAVFPVTPADGYPAHVLNTRLPEAEQFPQGPDGVVLQGPQGEKPDVSALIEVAKLGDRRWQPTMVRLTAHWVGRHFSDQEILVWARELTGPGYTEEQTEDQMRVMIEGARRKWAIPDQDHEAITATERGQRAFQPLPAPDQWGPALPDQNKEIVLSVRQMLDRYGEEPEFIVDGFLSRGHLCLLTGLPSSGKSPLAQDIAVRCALGIPWAGRNTTKARVAYISSESPHQTAINLAGFAQKAISEHRGCPVPFDEAVELADEQVLTYEMPFYLETDVDKMLAAFEAECAAGRRWGPTADRPAGPPDLVIFDTLRSMTTGAITKDEDMALVHQGITRIRSRWPTAAHLLLSHAPKGDPEGSAGSNRIEGMAEIVCALIMCKRGQSADEAKGLPRADRFGPDDKGWTYAASCLLTHRNKTWEAMPNLRILACTRDNEHQLMYGDAATSREMFGGTGIAEPENEAFASQNRFDSTDAAGEAILFVLSVTGAPIRLGEIKDAISTVTTLGANGKTNSPIRQKLNEMVKTGLLISGQDDGGNATWQIKGDFSQ